MLFEGDGYSETMDRMDACCAALPAGRFGGTRWKMERKRATAMYWISFL